MYYMSLLYILSYVYHIVKRSLSVKHNGWVRDSKIVSWHIVVYAHVFHLLVVKSHILPLKIQGLPLHGVLEDFGVVCHLCIIKGCNEILMHREYRKVKLKVRSQWSWEEKLCLQQRLRDSLYWCYRVFSRVITRLAIECKSPQPLSPSLLSFDLWGYISTWAEEKSLH